jgi:flagellar assembly factor FliW
MTTVDDQQVLVFPDGIPGFASARRFVLSDLDEAGTFQMLRCLDADDLSMVVCVPWLLFPEYQANIGDEEERHLELERPEDAVVFCPVTVEPEERAFHVNLLGPFVVNARTRRGRQVVLADSGYPTRASFHLDDLER